MDFFVGFGLGAIVASAVWWNHVRGLNGVISDLKDVSKDANAAITAVKAKL